MTLNLKIGPALEQRLREQAARRGLDADSYAVAAIEEKLQFDARPSPQLSHEESEILKQMGVGLPEQTWARYDELVAKRRAETLTHQEYEELMRLTNTVEEDHAKRIELLVKLSKIRSVPLKALMGELGIGSRQRGAANNG
jgi:hypothetical protein